MSFENTWSKIKKTAGEEFHTKTGKPFTYRIVDDSVVTSRTNYPLAKANFERAATLTNLTGPGQINDLVRGPAYVYAILTDSRIK